MPRQAQSISAFVRHAPHEPVFDVRRAPGFVRMALECRAPWEFAATLLSGWFLGQTRAGDGHPVLVFPGLIASDMSTRPLRGFLERKGYAAYGWEQGANLGAKDGVIDACIDRVRKLRRQHKCKVSLIGWSLGGVYAREVAKDVPNAVRQVITLGTPFTGHPKATNAWRLYELVAGHRIGAPEIHEPLRQPPPVPTTSIYSRSDGIVAWQCSVERRSAHTESIEIEASHFGMGLNAFAWYAIADRLAQPERGWRPFDRQGALRLLYRDPSRKTRF